MLKPGPHFQKGPLTIGVNKRAIPPVIHNNEISKIAKHDLRRIIVISFVVLFVGAVGMFLTQNLYLTVLSALIIAGGFTTLNISGLPFAIQNLSVRHVTYGVGIYIGASEVLTGLFEYVYR